VAAKDIKLEQWINDMEKTTKEEIVAVANKIELDTIYFLTGTEAVK